MQRHVRDLVALVLGAALALVAVEFVPTARAAPSDDLLARQVRAIERLADASRDQTAELGRLVRATERCAK